jgi:hypothetical protein
MKIRIDTTLVFETLMLVVVGAMLVAATRYPYGVKLVPFVVGVPTLILLLVLWLGSVFPEWKRLGRKRQAESQDAEKVFEDSDFTLWRPVLNTMGWITAYYILIFITGFFVATPVWLTAFFFRKANLSLVKSVLGGVFSSFAIIRMVHAFGIELWPGAIPKIITRILGGGIVPPL